MYRKNVCAIIFNEDLFFLGCKRINSDLYQFVQGGIEKRDTDLLQAAYRELQEEIGLLQEDLQFVGEILPASGDPREFRYELRSTANLRRFGFRGQEQRLMLFFTQADNIGKVNLVPPKGSGALQEFSHVEWMKIEDIIARCPKEKAHIFIAVRNLGLPMAKAFLRSRPAL
ncbi:putative NUDIX hydrolase, conserved [Trypanosoma conorhini]|uniref:Putative NUDIX hydrolase, conserved n=1 Tax=Trypanosoma conorhini TaxID=83891 RepID=A0A3S5IUM1_9TRYP|nr:putative NUDIX hydrolase, conserved [Trypanosoma conorhini]RNF26716.1 putative NUDIX hydrolase, conserved [Trypanosoma conorhini]